MHPVWRHSPELVFLLILAELLASSQGDTRPARTSARPASTPPPRRVHRPARGSLTGRRPRG